MSQTNTTGELARLVGGIVRGSPDVPIQSVGTVRDAGPNDITWVTDSSYFPGLASCRAAAVLGPANLPPLTAAAIIVDDVESAMGKILAAFEVAPWTPPTGCAASLIDPTAKIGEGATIGPFAVVGPRTTIGRGASIHAGVYIGADVTIGENCQLWPGVYVGDRCRLADRVLIWPNATIGRPGFGFILRQNRLQRIPQIGTVVLENDVEIGANTCIDRAKCGATRIGAGSKIDNLVQVAHNVRTGPGCILVGQVGLAGSVQLGTGVVLGGQVGVADNLTIGDGVRATAQTGVTVSIPAGKTVSGHYGQDRMKVLREDAAVRRLPELIEQVKELSRRVKTLEAAADDRQAG